MTTCNDIMKKDVVFVDDKDSVQVAAKLMADANVGFVPVCDKDGKPIGALTDRDIALRIGVEDKLPSNTSVGEVMTRDVIACRPDDDLEDAQQAMIDNQVSRLLVTDNDGKLCGVISLSDLARASETGYTVFEQITEREAYTD